MKNRDMFYQNTQAYNNQPFFIPNNYQYQMYGPNTLTNQNDYEDRISKLERQVKVLDTRLQKIETMNLDDNTNNFYMI